MRARKRQPPSGGRWKSALFRLTALCVLGATASYVLAREKPSVSDSAASGDAASLRIIYAPSAESASIDAETLATARATIDIAAYVLTERNVIEALAQAARRGARVRVYLDRSFTFRGSEKNADALAALSETPGVAVKFKARNLGIMHLKSYQVDGRLLRTGSSNFSFSGGRFQDNDIVFINDAAKARAFSAHFEEMWARTDNEGFSQ